MGKESSNSCPIGKKALEGKLPPWDGLIIHNEHPTRRRGANMFWTNLSNSEPRPHGFAKRDT